MQRLEFSPLRLWFLTLNALREAVRQSFLHCLVVLAVVVLLAAQAFREFHFGSPELKFIADVGLGAMAGFGAVLTVVTTAQLFFSEIERRTVLTLLAKPVGRAEFVLGKFLAVAVLVGAFCFLLTGLLTALVWARESALMREWPEVFATGRVINYGHLAVAGLLQWLKLLVLGALTLLLASYARTQLFTVMMGFLVYVLCHLQPVALAASGRGGSSATGVVAGLVVRAVPNFQLFSLADTIGGSVVLQWTPITRVALYAIAYVIVACALAVFCFRRREF